MMHLLPLMVLFATQVSYGLVLNPCFSSANNRCFQKSNPLLRHLYNALRRITYHMFCHYSSWRVFCIILVSHVLGAQPFGLQVVRVPIHPCQYLGRLLMSVIHTARSSRALIVEGKRTDSIVTVGDGASVLSMVSRCFLPSVQPRPFITPVLFSLSYMR